MAAGAWQHPFVNVFKHVRLEEWKKSSKEGDVTSVMDKNLKCTVYRIRGSIPAGNFIQLPKTSSQSLGLTGRFLYLLFRPLPGKHFVVHVDVGAENGQTIRISFSNIFKEFKSTATWLQFPFVCGARKDSIYDHTVQTARRDLVGPAPSGSRWTCLLLDLRYVLSMYLSCKYSHVKSVKLCSNLLVKNLMTSDLLFTPELSFAEARQAKFLQEGVSPMPREMTFPVPKGEKWHNIYDFIRFPSDGSKLPYDSIQKGQTTQTGPGDVASHSPTRERPRSVAVSKPVQDRVSLIQQITSPRQMPRRNPLRTEFIPERFLSVHARPEEDEESEQEATRDAKDDDDGGIHVYTHNTGKITIQRHDTDSEQVICINSSRPESLSAGTSCKKLLPDPILTLRKIIGFGGCTERCVLWTHTGCSVVYPCHAVIVALKVKAGEQRFFLGHTDKVSSLAFNGSCTLLASAQTGSVSMVRLWHFQKGTCLAMFKTHAHSVSNLSFSHSGSVLCGVGKDGHGKNMVVVWNTAQASRGGEVVVLAKAHTDVDIHTMKIAFFDDTRMVSCGRDNIRLWRVRNGSLRSCPVNLGEYHILDFMDLAFEVGHSPERELDDRALYVCSRSGHILEIDYKNVSLRNVRRLQPSQRQHRDRREKQTFNSGPGISVNTLSVSGAFCATGSEDGYLRLWPLDFSGVFLEAEHEGPVSCVAIGPDGLQVLSCTSSGELGVLDVPSRGYLTLMRSHTDSLLAFSHHPSDAQLATVSCDNTIRIWDMSSLQQLYDFTANEETPCAVVFHPTRQALACGFSSGVVRFFDVVATALIAEHKQHRGTIIGLLFSPDGSLMYSACSAGSLAMYNIGQKEQHVLRVLGNVVCKEAERGPQALSMSSDGRLLALVGPSEYTVTIMDARSLEELLLVDVSILDLDSTKLDGALSIAFSPRHPYQLLVTTSGNKVLWLDPKTGRLLKEVTCVHKQCCSSLAVSEDARYLLTAGDKVIKVWDNQLAGAARPQVFIGHSEAVQQVAFSPDQQHVISAGDAIFIWSFEAAPDPEDVATNASDRPPLALHSSAADHEAEQRRDSTFIANGMPRRTAPRPCIASPPRLDISPVQSVGRETTRLTSDRLSESEDEAAEDQMVQERPVSEDLTERDEQSSLVILECPSNRTKLPWVSKRNTSVVGEDLRSSGRSTPRPDSYMHFNARFKTSSSALGICQPPEGQEMLVLKAAIGYNGNGRGNMVWNPDSGFFAYSCGSVIVLEDLHSGSQRHWLGHPEEISTMALSNDVLILASASGNGDGSSLCQIRVWDTRDGACVKILQHHNTEVQAMSFSRDDRLLMTIGDYRDGSLALWNTKSFELMASSRLACPAHAGAFNPSHADGFACVGTGAVSFWRIEELASGARLKVYRAPVPDDVGPSELTSMAYNSTSLLYTGCSTGQVCVWDTLTHRCFMTWEADQGEIGVLQCKGNRLVSGSNTRRIRLWSVAVVQELREKGSDASSTSVLMEHEITLDGAIVSATFDEALDMGIVGTTAGTLWYINWVENTSIRLISGHRNKVTDLAVSPGESHCATCGEDGSVRIWSLHNCELLLQFQVLNQSCLCVTWSPACSSRKVGQHIAAGYSDGTIRIFSVSNTEMEMKIHPHPCAVTAIAYSTSGDVLVSGGKDGLMAISSPRTGMTIRVLSDHKGSPVTALECARRKPEELGLAGGDLWLAASSDRRVSVWISDWSKDKCELLDWLSFPAPAAEKEQDSTLPSLAAFCPWQPGTVVYTGFGTEKEVLFYSLVQKQVLLKVPLSRFATSLAMSHTSSLLALGSNERILRIIDSVAGTQQDFTAHDDRIHLCRVSPSGNLLFTASYNQVLLWNVHNS